MESPVLHGEILNFDERVKNNGKTQVLSILFQKETYSNLIVGGSVNQEQKCEFGSSSLVFLTT